MGGAVGVQFGIELTSSDVELHLAASGCLEITMKRRFSLLSAPTYIERPTSASK